CCFTLKVQLPLRLCLQHLQSV
ncbi:transporter, anaerobic C4-dicarboxylate uptake family protein, partial [Vibrio parahaemolyticus VP2007-007]